METMGGAHSGLRGAPCEPSESNASNAASEGDGDKEGWVVPDALAEVNQISDSGTSIEADVGTEGEREEGRRTDDPVRQLQCGESTLSEEESKGQEECTEGQELGAVEEKREQLEGHLPTEGVGDERTKEIEDQIRLLQRKESFRSGEKSEGQEDPEGQELGAEGKREQLEGHLLTEGVNVAGEQRENRGDTAGGG